MAVMLHLRCVHISLVSKDSVSESIYKAITSNYCSGDNSIQNGG